MFDSDGRLLVSPDGHLPSEIITDTFLEKSANDQFGTAHPLFQWMFQASRNWPIIQTLIAGMENHLAHLPRSSKDVKTGISLMTEHGAPIDNYDLIVRELFCVAAATLADKMKLSLSQVGVLWDEILPTGAGHVRNSRPGTIASAQCGSEVAAASPALPRSETTSSQAAQAGKNSNMTVTTAVQSPEDLAEKGLNNLVDNRRQSVCYQQHQQQQQQQQNHSVYRGSLMFLVRTADRAEVERLQAAGYRFAELHQVSGKIATTMQIKAPLSASTKPGAGSAFESKLRNMAAYAHGNGTDAMLEPGVHLGFFGVRARVGHYGFDVVVRRGMRNLLPSVRIPGLARLDAWHVEFLARLDRMTPTAVLRRLEAIVSTAEAAGGNGCSPKEAGFAAQLADAIDRLRRDWLSDNDPALFDESVLTARAVDVPCRPADGSGDGSLNMCSLIAFRVVIPIHASRPPPEGPCELVPLSFFKVHQLSCRDSPHHAIFARSVHRELAPLIYSVPWDPKLLGKHHHHYHHQYHHRLFQPYPPQSDKLLTTTTHSSSADDSATTASRRRASLSIRGSLVVQNKLRKSLGKAPADDCEGISHEGIGSGPEDDSDSHSTRSSSTLKLWPGRGSTAATDVDSAATSPAHYQEHHGHQHQETPALAAIGESSVPSSSPKPASNMAMTSGAAAAGSTSPPLPASRSPVPPQAAQLHQPSQSTALGGIMVSSEITVQVHDLPSRQNGGVRFLASSVSSPSGQELATAEGRRVSLSLGNNTGQASTPGSGSSLLARRTSIQTQQRRQSLQFSGEMQQQQLPEPPEQDKDNKSSTNNHRPATAKSTGTGAGAAGAPIELQPLTPRMASIIGAPMPAATAAAAATTTGASAAVEVERAAGARETFVDELFAICVEGR